MSAKEFVADLNASSLSIDEIKFEENMKAAKLTSKVTGEAAPATQMSPTNQPGKTERNLSNNVYDINKDSRG